MTIINLTTEIKASIERCFDISRDIDIHQQSVKHTKERAIGGRTTGMCDLNDEILWEATHFGIKQRLSSKIIQMNRPHSFTDTMLKGAFKSMVHEHHFEEKNGVTTMKDIFKYEVPFGIIGSLFDKLVLKNYMTRFLKTRNALLKAVLEKESSPA